MKIDNCDLPGKQKWRGVVMCKRMLFRVCAFVCEWRGVVVGVNDVRGWGLVGEKKRERKGKWEQLGQSRQRRPGKGWVGTLPGGGNLSNWFSLTARTQRCLSTWQTDSVRFSPMY